jgi:hypothetical protein
MKFDFTQQVLTCRGPHPDDLWLRASGARRFWRNELPGNEKSIANAPVDAFVAE